MSLGQKTLLIASLALTGLGFLLYLSLANILSPGSRDEIIVSYVTVSVVVAGGGFFLVTLLLINQLVLTRLGRVNAAIRKVGASHDFSKRLEIDHADELGALSLEINGLLGSLQEAQQAALSAKLQGTPEALSPPAITGYCLPVGNAPFGAEQLLGTIFRAAPVMLAVCSAEDQRFIEVSDSFLHLVGLSREKLLGHTLTEVEIWGDGPTRKRWLQLLAREQSVREAECQLRTSAGEPRDALVSIEWLRVGAASYFVLAACDITGRVEQEAQLRQAQKMEGVGQLSARFAHDFNNVLAVVQGYASILISSPSLEPQTQKALKEVAAAADRGAYLTRQLLTFSRKQIMQPKTLDLNCLLQGLESTLQRLLGESSALKFSFSPDTPAVRADPAMIEQVIVNLAANARECMPRGGQFAIHTGNADPADIALRQKPGEPAARFACITVTDTGCGFEPASLTRIFDTSFSTNPKGGAKTGGMGLAAVYSIVKQHQGWIDAISELGRGTTFKLFLPAETKAASAKAPPPGLPKGDERILLVEDELGLCTMVEGILRRCGYKVFTAPNGIQAMQLWKQQKGQFELLLTDMVMPEGLTGRQLAEKLKVQNPALKVIYSSGYSVELVNKDGFELAEGLTFLQKPYHPQKLAQTVRACLDSPADTPVEEQSAVLAETATC